MLFGANILEPNPMKLSTLLSFGFLLVGLQLFSACKNTRNTATVPVPVEFKVHAKAQVYTTAMGKGRGVLFHIYIDQPDSVQWQSLSLDSLIINGKFIPASIKTSKVPYSIEGNYFVATKDPEPNQAPLPTLEVADPVLFLSQYLPANLYLHYQSKPYIIPIEHFESVHE